MPPGRLSKLEPFLDASHPIGAAAFALLAALAKQDSDIKAERPRGAKGEIRAVGGRHSGSAPYGMRAVREQIGNLVVSVLEPEDVPAPGEAERRATEKRMQSYPCANPKGHGGLSIKREDADDYVARRVWARLAAADVADHEGREWPAEEALRFALQRDLSGVQEERRETAAHLEHVRNSIAGLQADHKAGLYRGLCRHHRHRSAASGHPRPLLLGHQGGFEPDHPRPLGARGGTTGRQPHPFTAASSTT
ncbi:hypothetical protein [Streptomyces cinereoruber]|uniref:hypothetical protein n=1 Tax=Streptomyces cinereoruber TaxID=67260 RepID=UPI003C2AFA4C